METPEDDIFLAKWVYEAFAGITSQTLGPAWRIYPPAMKVAEVLTPAMHSIVAQSQQIGDTMVWEVPSPWHAVLYLGALQHHLSLNGRRALFRGQSNSDWAVSPSIARAGIDKERETRKGRLFCELLSALSLNTVTSFHPSTRHRFDLRISPDSYWAAAQHYGIKTNLIDFTTDPAIGVYFACSGRNPKPDQTASVFIAPLDIALKEGLQVVLPPPFAERLYIQRGVFVRSDCTLDAKRYGMLEIRFPAIHTFGRFRVIRPSAGMVDVLPENEAMSELLKLIDEQPEPDGEAFERMAAKLKPAMATVYKDPLLMWAKYVDFLEDQLYWLAYKVDENSESLLVDVLDPILLANREVASAAAQFYRWSAKLPPDMTGHTDEKKAHLLRLADLFESIIK